MKINYHMYLETWVLIRVRNYQLSRARLPSTTWQLTALCVPS